MAPDLGRVFGVSEENVVLIDEEDRELGVGEKLAVHQSGVLHRAFSVFAFNPSGDLLLQRRALGKYHSPGLWTNSACGHPRPGETTEDAAARRFAEELGIEANALEEVGILRYRAELADLVENELDHLLVTEISIDPAPDPDEVMEWRFVPLDELDDWIARAREEAFTAWFPPAWEIVSARVRSTRA